MENKEDLIVQNLKECPHFDGCSQNLCPLDLELHLRHGNKSDKCRFMREAKRTKIRGREFVSGGRVMPDALLILVPNATAERLNEASRKRYNKLISKKYGK